MKILMINVVCGIKSTGRICTDLATELEAEGHEVRIAYGREEVPEQFKKYAVRIGSETDVRLHGAKARLIDGCGFGSKRATERFIEWVREYDPDVIHLHNLHGYYINLEVLFDYLKTSNKKTIWTLHDCWAFTGHSALCDAVDCTRWKTGCYDCPNMKEYPASFTDHSRANWLKKKEVLSDVPDMIIVTPSNWLAGLVKKSFLKEYPVEVVNNGIDTSQFYPMESNFKKTYGIVDKIVLLGVATTWNDLKGYSDFLKLADMLDDQYRIVLVGLSEEQVKALPDSIIGIERTNSLEELAKIYSAADLFVNLTYCDTYPTVNIEAIACGTQVVTYNVGGSAEAAGKDGIVVPKGSLNDIKKAVEAAKPFHCEKKGERDFIPDVPTKTSMIEQYKAIITTA